MVPEVYYFCLFTKSDGSKWVGTKAKLEVNEIVGYYNNIYGQFRHQDAIELLENGTRANG